MAGRKGEKFWADAVRVAVNREVEEGDNKGRKILAVVAEKLATEAMGGDMQAIKEIGDRLDGKPQQSVDLEVTANPLTSLLERIAEQKTRVTDEQPKSE